MYFYGTIAAQRQGQNLTVSHLSERARPASHKPAVSIENHGGTTSPQTVITRRSRTQRIINNPVQHEYGQRVCKRIVQQLGDLFHNFMACVANCNSKTVICLTRHRCYSVVVNWSEHTLF